MSDHAGENLLRMLAASELSIREVARRSGLDERTVRGIARGVRRPHPRTLYCLARGLGVPVDEFFVDPAQLLYRRFDRRTNPLVEEVLQGYPDLFQGWGEAQFDELHSRVGAGGPLTFEGALTAVHAMNRKRQLHERLDLLLETGHAKTVGGILDLMYEQVQVVAGNGAPRPARLSAE